VASQGLIPFDKDKINKLDFYPDPEVASLYILLHLMTSYMLRPLCGLSRPHFLDKGKIKSLIYIYGPQ